MTKCGNGGRNLVLFALLIEILRQFSGQFNGLEFKKSTRKLLICGSEKSDR